MRLQSGYIHLHGLRFHAYHGVLPQERSVGNNYVVSLRIGYPVEAALASDDVADTLNYAEVYRLVEQEMGVPSQLVERVAARMAERLFRQYPRISTIDIHLTKQNPPMGACCDGAGVELHFTKD